MSLPICVDFDGTIVDHVYPEIGKPVPGAIDYLKKWNNRGAKIILFTMRSGKHLYEAEEYLKEQGVVLYGSNRNPDQDDWTTSPKAYGRVYVDDAAFGCPLVTYPDFQRPCVNWTIVGPTILQRL